MKKLFAAALLLMAFTPVDLQSSAEQKVRKHIIDNASGAGSYQSLSFGKLEKYMLPFNKTNVGQSYLQSARVSLTMAKKGWEELMSPGWSSNKAALAGQVEELEKDVEKYMHQYDSAAKNYRPVQYGWKIFHKYKLKDDESIPQVYEDTFYLNKKLQVIDTDTITVVID
jgi:hypothetical protein